MSKGNSSARKPSTASREKRNPKKRILVVTEGTVTEPQYFEKLQQEINDTHNVVIDISPKPPNPQHKRRPKGNRNPDPISVVEECIAKKNETDLPYEACFAIVDVDGWDKSKSGKQSKLDEAFNLAKNNDIKVLVSNVKFEVWLVWHLEGEVPKRTSNELDQQCKEKDDEKGKRKKKEKGKEILKQDGKDLHRNFPIANYETARQQADRKQKVMPNTIGENPSSAIPRLFDELDKHQLPSTP